MANQPESGTKTGVVIFLSACLLVLTGAVCVASLVQRDFGRVEVTNVRFKNYNGIPIRAKLLRPKEAGPDHRLPGVVYIHGYQNNRETGDAYCIEAARRGFVVLNIDAIGRGNSGLPNRPEAPDFDKTYGGKSALAYLRSLPFVRAESVGMMGHSLGAEMAYRVALADPGVRALVITGFAYTLEASQSAPKNMLMIIGKWDEYRPRMTGVRDIEREWMDTPRTKKVVAADRPQLGRTYGSFEDGTARRVVVPRAIHIQVSHSGYAVAETVEWLRQALGPPPEYSVDPEDQVWPIKEWATLLALVAGLAFLLPLGQQLLGVGGFKEIVTPLGDRYICSGGEFIKHASINGLLMWLYLPLIFCLFGIHIYIIRIDGVFPMMLLNAIVWWFVLINLIGFFIFRRWFKKRARTRDITLSDLGISYRDDGFGIDARILLKTAILAVLLFAAAYGVEHGLEALFIVDYRFIFPFASDLTWARFKLFLVYLPFFLFGFIQTGVFLHGQIRRPLRSSRTATFLIWSVYNTAALVVPLALFMLIQYVPLLTTGFIPFVGPGGMLTNFTMTLFHIIGVLALVTPISTWFYIQTGKIYLGAFLTALIVCWMLVSSQVVAPIPV